MTHLVQCMKTHEYSKINVHEKKNNVKNEKKITLEISCTQAIS